MNLFPKRKANPKPTRFMRPRLESLEDRNVMADDLEGDTLTSAMALNLGLGSLYKHSATIGDGNYPTKDVDLYSVSLTAGQRLTSVVVAIAPEEGGYSSLSAMDSYLRIFNSSGTELALNDDGTNPFTGSSTTDSCIKFVAPSSGNFYIGVCGYGSENYNPSTGGSANVGSLGAYRLEVVKADVAAPPAPTGFSGSISSAGTVSLSWNSYSNATGYSLERRNATYTSNAWEAIATLDSTQTSYNDSPPNANTTYQYRLQNISLGGPSLYSSSIAATTLLAPPTSLSASLVSGNQIDLNWVNSTSTMTSVYIEKSTSSTSGFSKIASVSGNATTYSASGPFQGSSTYYFRVRYFLYDEDAPGGGYYSAYSSTASATVADYPAQPTNLTATAVSTSEISLAWSDTSNETGYKVEQQISGSWSTVTTLGANQTTYHHTDLNPGSTHTYRVIASNASGSSAPSLSASATTDTQSQAEPTVTFVSGSRADLSWGVQPNDDEGTAIEQSLNGTSGWTQIGSVISGETTYTSNGPFLGSTTYYFRLRSGFYPFSSYNPSGAYSSVFSATSPGFPSQPTGLAGTATSHSTISLTWTDASSETSYRIERMAYLVGGWTVAGTVGQNITSFADSGLSENQTYYYRVFAINGFGESAPSFNLEKKTLLASPTNVVATSVSGSRMNLSWVDRSQSEWSYLIEQSLTGTGNWSQVATAGGDQTQYSVSGSFNSSTTYYFRIRALAYLYGYGSSGYTYYPSYSQYSETASVITSAYANQPTNFVATPLSDSAIKLTWNDTANESSYRIEQLVDSTWTTLATPAANTTEYTHSGLTEFTFHSYRIIGINSVGQSVPSTTATVSTSPKAPGNLSVTAISSSRIDLSWSDLSDAESNYEIEQSPDGTTNWTSVGSVYQDSTSFSAPGPFDGSTSYFFRVRAKIYNYFYPQGLVLAYSNYSSVSSTTTPAFPSKPTGLIVTPTSHSTLKLDWEDLPNETSYRIERYDQSTWPASWISLGTVSANTTQFSATGLMEGYPYQFRIVAVNALGESQPSLIGNGRTLLAAPTQLAATVYSGSRIELSWVDNSTIEQSYYVEMASQANNDWRQIGWLPANSTHFTAKGPFNGSTGYAFRVKAYHPGYGAQYLPNSSLYSDLLQLQTPAFPDVPSGVQAVAASSSAITLSWTDLPNETTYRIERSETTSPYDWSLIDELPANTTTFTDSSCWEGTPFYYRVIAANSLGDSAPSFTISATTKLGSPTNFTAVPYSGAKMVLNWVDHSFNETGFVIEQSLNGTSNWVAVGSTAANVNHFDAPGPFLGSTSYSFRVKAIKQGPNIHPSLWNESAYTTVVQATTPGFPNPPTGLTATSFSDRSITLTWTDLPNETDYMIERQAGTSWASIETVGANVTSYTDSGLEEGRSYVYRITAINTSGQSAAGQPVSVLTHLATPTGMTAQVISGGRIDLSWTDNSAFEAYYALEQSLDGVKWSAVNGYLPANTTSFTATGPFNGSTNYQFRVRAYKTELTAYSPANDSLNSNIASPTTPAFPNQPTGLTTGTATATTVALSWSDLPNETGFRLERSASLSGPSPSWSEVQVLSANTTSYVDSGLTEGTLYSYRIIALNGFGESAASLVKQVKTKPGTPTGLAATVVSGGKIDLTWVDGAQGENGFQIEMLTDGVAGWRFIGSTGANQTTFSATGPFDGAKSYSFRVIATALDYGQNPQYLFSAPSNVASVTTPALPNQPANFLVTGISDTELNLTWNDLPNETQYRVERLTAGVWNTVNTVSANTTSLTISGLTEYSLATFRVVAINALGESAPSSQSIATTLLATPTNLVATAVSGSKVDLTWNDNSHFEEFYVVEMSLNGTTGWSSLGLLPANSMSYSVVRGFEGTTSYYFRVRSYLPQSKPVGLPLYSLNGQTASIVTPAFPSAPSEIALSPVSDSAIQVSWTDVANETSYRIEHMRLDDGQWTLAGTVSQNVTKFTDSGLSEAAAYRYRVTALNAAGESANFLTPQATTMLAAPSNLTATYGSGRITLDWVDHSASEIGFDIEQSAGAGKGWIRSGSTDKKDVTTFVVAGPFDGSTTYSFRVRAVSQSNFNPPSNYSQYSADASVTTPVIPAKPTGLIGTANSDTSITLNWADLPSETGYRIERDSNGQWVTLTTVPANTTNYTDLSGLTEGTLSTYRVIATGGNGDSPPSNPASVRALLKAPTGLTASIISGSRIDLNWADQSAIETGYIVEQSVNGSTLWVQAGQVGVNVTQFSAPGPFAGQTSYSFRVRALDSKNLIAAGPNRSLNTQAVSVTTPAFTAPPSNVVITSRAENAISLSWDDLSNETQYKIERNINGSWSLVGTTAAGVTTFTDSNLIEGTAYTYQVSGSNSSGEGTPSVTVQASTKLAKPSGVIAIVDSPAQATITWTDHSNFESNFIVEKSLNGVSDWTYFGLAAAKTTSLIATGSFASSTTYYFRVKANAYLSGDSDWSQLASATTPAFPTQPKGFGGTANSDTSITLTWTDLPNESGYRVEKLVSEVWTALQTLNADVVSYTQNGLSEGSDHTYRVVAIANGIDSLPSAQLNLSTYLKSPSNLAAQPVSASRIDLTWADLSDLESGYVIEQSIAGSNSWSVSGRVDQNIHTYQAPGPFQGSVSYSFRVRAISVNGSSDTSTPVTIVTPAFPNAPSGLKGKALSDTTISLSWPLSAGITSYRIERAEKLYIGYGNWLPIQSSAGNQSSYIDTALVENTTYVYRVIAANTVGDSSPSGVLSITTMPRTPTELTGTVVSGGKIDLTWIDQSHPDILYAVEQQASNSSSWVAAGTSQTNSVSLPGPFDGDITYRFRVRAFSLDGGFSQYCEPITLTTPDLPNQPLSFTATSLSTTEISFTWDPVSNTDHYSLQKLQDNSTEIWSEVGTTLGTNQSYSLIDLPEGYRGSYRLIAINLQGSSSPSQSVSASTNLLPPTNLTATAISGGKIHLTWENLSTLRTGFAIEQSIDGLAWDPVNNPRINTTAFDASGPFKGSTPYYFRVKTVNDLTDTSSQYSTPSALVTPAYPNQPGSLSAIALGPTEIKLTWQVVANAQGYKIQRLTGGQNEWTTIYTGQTGTLAFTDSELSEFCTYSYRLIASNSSGESAPSQVATVQTMLWSPGSLTASASSGSTLDLTWINRSTFTSSITFEISTNNVNWLPLKIISGATTSTSITKPLDGSTTYYIRAVTTSLYPFNYSPYSIIEITTPSFPNRPSLNNPVVLTPNSVQLSWIDLPNEASYSLERKMGGSALWSEVATIQANNTSYIDTNLSSSAKYIYRLSAVNNSGKSAYSDEVTALTLPDSINNISATLITEDRLDLNWNRPEKPYAIRIESRLSSTGPWSLVGVSNPNSATFSVPGPFISLTSYFFRLTAFNASGSSESAYVSFTTPALLGAPSNLLVESISPTSLQLSWQAAQQSSQYHILRRLTNGDWINIGQVPAGTLTYTDTSNLNIGVLYQYGVAAIYDERLSGIARSGLVLAGNGTDDADMDDVPNILEANLGTDPTKLDTDGDGFPDGWELEGEVFDPLQPDDPEGDEDEDGLSNWDEYEIGTDPGYEDSDEDGVEDALELTSGADPLNPSDEGIAPEPELISKFNLRLGVPNKHLWEKWDVQVGNWTLTHTPGMVNQKEIQLKQGGSYPVYLRATMNTAYGIIPDQPIPGPMDPDQPGYGTTIRPAQGDENKPYFFSGDPQFFNTKSSFSDSVWYRNQKSVLNLPSLDVDVDSDNTNGYNSPDESAYEDSIEGYQQTVKMLPANTGNIDEDSYPDWTDDKIPNAHFTPIIVKLSDNIWLAKPHDIVFTFDYSLFGGGTHDGSSWVSPTRGNFRIWKKDAHELRQWGLVDDASAGDRIIPKIGYTAEELGFSEEDDEIILYAEGVVEVDQVLPLVVKVDIGGELWSGTLTDTVHFSIPKDRIVMLMDSRVPKQENNYPIYVEKEKWDYFIQDRSNTISSMLQSVENIPLPFFSRTDIALENIRDALSSLESLAAEIKTESIKLIEFADKKEGAAFLNQLSFVAEKYDWYLVKYINVTYKIANFEARAFMLSSPYQERYGRIPLTFSDLKIAITRPERDALNTAFSYAGSKYTEKIGNLDLTIGAGKALALAAIFSSPLLVASLIAGPGSPAVWAVAGVMAGIGAISSVASRWREIYLGNAGLFGAVVYDVSGYTNFSVLAYKTDPVTGKVAELNNEEWGAAITNGIIGLTFAIKGIVSGMQISIDIPSDMFTSFRPSAGQSLRYSTGGVLALTAESVALVPEFTIATPRPVTVTTAVVSVGPKQFILSMTAQGGGGEEPTNEQTPPNAEGENPPGGVRKGTIEISDEGLITKAEEYPKYKKLAHTAEELSKRGYDVIIGGEAEHMASEITLKPGAKVESFLYCESKLLDKPTRNAVQLRLRKGTDQSDFMILDGTASNCSLAEFYQGFSNFLKFSIPARKLEGKRIHGKILFLFGEAGEVLVTY